MPTFRITYRPDAGHPAGHEHVDADRVDLEAETFLVFRQTVFVIGRPREVVTRRIPAGPVAEVVEVA